MTLKNAETKEQMRHIRALYEEAFPKSEKKPFALMKKMRRDGNLEFLCVEEEDGDFQGLAIMILCGELALLDYFAIMPECRGRNVGSEALKALRQRYADRRLLLEIESTAGLEEAGADFGLMPENGAQRLRRKNFYLRNGMEPMDYRVDLFGEEMEILTYGGRVVFEEYHAIFEKIFPKGLAKKVSLVPEAAGGTFAE